MISRTLSSTELRDEAGELTLGGQTNSNFYTGTLQDVRIYSGILQPRYLHNYAIGVSSSVGVHKRGFSHYIICFLSQVEVISGDPAALSLTPISGYISYAANTATATIALNSVDDDTPEPSELFILSLTNVEGGARLSGIQDTAIITVLKSDFSNGIFGFTSDSGASVIDEPGVVTLSVNRSAGSFDGVTLTWEVREVASGLVATRDFSPASGVVVFEDGETLQTFVVAASDEDDPELDEDFMVVLTSAVTNDNQTSSTPSSGASIDAGRSQAMLTVTENDFPYGVIQFSASPPLPGQPIALATVVPELLVRESDGNVTVYVVRAQGTVGTVNIEFHTSDGMATHQGLQPDYVSNAGPLTFAPGDTVQSFQVMLVDNTDPELAKTFYVNLTNPQGGKPLTHFMQTYHTLWLLVFLVDAGLPELDVGQSMAITIQPSDDAFGRFSFSTDSLSHIVMEQEGGVPLSFTVLRAGGSFGEVSVFWRVSQEDVEEEVRDVTPPTGMVVFVEGERQQQFTLTVADDLVRHHNVGKSTCQCI